MLGLGQVYSCYDTDIDQPREMALTDITPNSLISKKMNDSGYFAILEIRA